MISGFTSYCYCPSLSLHQTSTNTILSLIDTCKFHVCHYAFYCMIWRNFIISKMFADHFYIFSNVDNMLNWIIKSALCVHECFLIGYAYFSVIVYTIAFYCSTPFSSSPDTSSVAILFTSSAIPMDTNFLIASELIFCTLVNPAKLPNCFNVIPIIFP